MATVERSLAPSAWDVPPPDEVLFEIIDGEFVEKMMGAQELELASILQRILAPFVHDRGLGRSLTEPIFDFRPILDRGRRPDLAFISAETYPLARRAPRTPTWRIVPDLAVEVVSPSNLAGEMMAKVEEYFLVGVSRVWVIYPGTCEIYAYAALGSVRIFRRGQVLTEEAFLPGFALDLDEFFGPVE